MNEEYDVIILGTGLKECIISGLLSVDGKKVLQIDRNDYYGAETASLSIDELYKKLKKDGPQNEDLIKRREFIVDLCPKFLMACGDLVKVLIHTKVTRYMEFGNVHGAYVYKGEKLHKMPATPSEAMKSSLMGIFQKYWLKRFLMFAEKFDEKDPKTTQYMLKTLRETFQSYYLDENSITSISHALALQLDDSHLDDPARNVEIIKAIKLYAYSVNQYGMSPFIYPTYSLSNLPESFARLSAIYGGTYMLRQNFGEILYDESGKVCGIKSDGKEARCKMLLGDPSYFGQGSSKAIKKVARWIFILDHPIAQISNAESCQIVIPGSRAGRKNDIYVALVGKAHKVAPEGMFIAVISTIAETENPKEEMKLARGLLGDAVEDFFFVSDYLEPTKKFNEKDDGCFMSSSYDATTHFQTVTQEVLQLYKRMSGKDFDSSIRADAKDLEQM